MEGGLTWLELPAAMDSLAPAIDFVSEGARRAGLPEESFGKLELILEEVLVNVFTYAYPEESRGTVEVGYSIPAPHCLEVEIRDAGLAYNPLEAPPPDLSLGLHDRPVGGLGVLLVKKMADSVSYRRDDGKNVLSFRLQ